MSRYSNAGNILIIEDELAKSRSLKECLVESGFNHGNITETSTILVASQLLDADHYCGVILDLAFHESQRTVYSAEKPFLAGIKIMQQLYEIRSKTPVIVATQHQSFESTEYGVVSSIDDLRVVLFEAFPDNFREIIEVELSASAWRIELIRAVRRHFK